MSLRLTPEAEADIEEAYAWYRERGDPLGAAFLNALEACLSTIEEQPERFPMVYEQVRRALLRRFPYSILYVADEDIVVIACFHGARDPKSWQTRYDA